jgi:hypothetical protein
LAGWAVPGCLIFISGAVPKGPLLTPPNTAAFEPFEGFVSSTLSSEIKSTILSTIKLIVPTAILSPSLSFIRSTTRVPFMYVPFDEPWS